MSQRVLKFRCWDKTGGMMFYSKDNDFTQMKADRPNSYGALPEGSLSYMAGTYPVMQFTGLLDSDGKEIYEGDILQFTHIRRATPFPVYWVAAQARFSDWSPRDKVGIIGNVYENPEADKEARDG